MKPLHILWTGSRYVTDLQVVRRAALAVIHSVTAERTRTGGGWVWVHGAARGLDSLVDRAAAEFGAVVERHPADWDAHGKAAGVMRNAEMAELGADLCLAFPLAGPRALSRGTWDMIDRAAAAGIPVRIYPVRQ